jgi:uncharacterized protein YjiS (DUF1127 family)
MPGVNNLDYSLIIRKAHAARARLLHVMMRRLRRKLRKVTTSGHLACRRLVTRFATALVSWWRAHAERRRCLRVMGVLRALSDRELKDIGVCRSEIYWVARHGRQESTAFTHGKFRPVVLPDPMPASPQNTVGPAEGANERKRAA